MGLIIKPDEWLVEFLETGRNTYDGNGNSVPMFALAEIDDVNKITLPSIIYTPGTEEYAELLDGTYREALNFLCDCKAKTLAEATDIRDLAIQSLDNDNLTEGFVFGTPQLSFAEILELDQVADSPVFNAGFMVAIRY